MPPNPTGPTNVKLRMLVRFLRRAAKSYDAPIWAYVADLISRSRRQRVVVNLSKLNRVANDGDVVVVPGKLLGGGEFKKKITIAAVSASRGAAEAVLESGAQLMPIAELVKKNPKGTSVKIVV